MTYLWDEFWAWCAANEAALPWPVPASFAAALGPACGELTGRCEEVILELLTATPRYQLVEPDLLRLVILDVLDEAGIAPDERAALRAARDLQALLPAQVNPWGWTPLSPPGAAGAARIAPAPAAERVALAGRALAPPGMRLRWTWSVVDRALGLFHDNLPAPVEPGIDL